MKSHHLAIALGLLAGAAVLPATLTAQPSTRYRTMDDNRDGVITRTEWRGNDQSFRRHDRNNDGVLTAAEINAIEDREDRIEDREDRNVNDGYGLVGDFSRVDLDGNGHVTAQEWRRAFTQLDDNRDGSLTQDELRLRNNRAPVVTQAFQAGRDRGLIDGRRAGREDGQRRVWDLDGQRELERADAGYRSDVGARDQYQSGYREGFRQGYSEGYGPRR